MRRDYFQKNLFDDFILDENPQEKEIAVSFSDSIVSKFQTYTLEKYIKDIENDGLSYTWAYICDYVLAYGENRDFLKVCNFGEMYEIGLAIKDKKQKKNNGQYYTPEDVASTMGEWFESLDGENVCDHYCPLKSVNNLESDIL